MRHGTRAWAGQWGAGGGGGADADAPMAARAVLCPPAECVDCADAKRGTNHTCVCRSCRVLTTTAPLPTSPPPPRPLHPPIPTTRAPARTHGQRACDWPACVRIGMRSRVLLLSARPSSCSPLTLTRTPGTSTSGRRTRRQCLRAAAAKPRPRLTAQPLSQRKPTGRQRQDQQGEQRQAKRAPGQAAWRQGRQGGKGWWAGERVRARRRLQSGPEGGARQAVRRTSLVMQTWRTTARWTEACVSRVVLHVQV